jgi:hypothetical protein
MKKFLLFTLVLFTNYNSYAQQVSLTKGEEFVSENGLLKKIIAAYNNSFYVLREEEKSLRTNYFLEKYDTETFKRDWVAPLEPLVIAEMDKILLEKDKISFYYMGYDKATTSSLISKFSVDTKTGKALPLETIYSEKPQKYTLSLSLSSDSTMHLLKYGIFSPNPFEPFGGFEKVKLFDIKLKKEIFTKDLPVNFNNEKVFCQFVNVDNSGNLLCHYETCCGKNQNLFQKENRRLG